MASLKQDGLPKLVGGQRNDATLQRFGWAILVSVLVNLLIWWRAAGFVQSHVVVPPQPIEVQRIFLPSVKYPKPVPPRKIIKPKPIINPQPAPVIKPKIQPKSIVPSIPPMRPMAAHNHVLTTKEPVKVTQNALPGGHAPLGVPIEHQNVGVGQVNNPPPPPPPVPPPPAPKPEPLPAPPSNPKPDLIPTPTPPPQAVSSGPTQDAQAVYRVMPEIPDDLMQDDYQSSVRVTVQIDAAGKITSVTLRSFSGNAEVDQRVIDALKRWRWKPELQDGKPVASTQRFRFEFEVH